MENSFRYTRLILIANIRIIISLVLGEIRAKYNWSNSTLVWQFLNPTIMICVYVFVFGIVFGGIRSQYDGVSIHYGFFIFINLLTYGILSEAIISSVNILKINRQYVKQISFPTILLPISSTIISYITFGFGYIIFVPALLIFSDTFIPTIFLIPIIVLPLMVISLSISIVFSCLGVLIRDLPHACNYIVTVGIFLSPIFYSQDSIPDKYKFIIIYNPVTPVINNVKQAIIGGEIYWSSFLIEGMIGLLLVYTSFNIYSRLIVTVADDL